MSVTLLTACAIQDAAYRDDPEAAPDGIAFVERYDRSTVQGWLYEDAIRERVGFVGQGSNERRDWLRNIDFRAVEVDGHELHNGWWAGAEPLADWCAGRGVREIQGHSKAGPEGEYVGWRLDRLLHGGRPTTHVVSIAGGKGWRGTPPRLKALCLHNPDDAVPHLPPFPGWKRAGVQVTLAWSPPDIEDDHRMAPVRDALLRSDFSIWQLAIADGEDLAVGVPSLVAPGIERRDSRVRPAPPPVAAGAA